MTSLGMDLAAVLGGILGREKPMEGSDDDLLLRSQRGDRNAFSRLVERYQDRAFTLARNLTGDSSQGEDLAQEAFLRAYRALDSFQVGRPFYPWLVTILRNLARNRLRSRVPVPVEVGEGAAEPVARAPGPEARVEANWDRASLRQEVSRLPAVYREVVVLRYLQDRRVREVAELLGIPESTVKTYLFRARELLRQRWIEKEGRR